jgi:DNA-binding transcriptional ArsR family regulator
MSQQAISLHVKVLTDCGLVIVKQQGRERFCEADLSRLGEVAAFIDQYRQHWESRFNKLEKYIAKLKKERYGKKKK